ncbi:MAG: HTTM domain-containing protein [Bernardetiaceae bacterium]
MAIEDCQMESLPSTARDTSLWHGFLGYLEQPVSVAPLVWLRIVFGGVMLLSTLRYMWMGWVDTQLVEPLLHFSYYGFDWVKPLPRLGMYAVFVGMALASVGIALGWYYRFSALVFFLLFTYVELIDITYYLNHYYFVSLVAFLLIWVPAHRYCSLDALRCPSLRQETISRWCVLIFQVQIAIVYLYAGLAKINTDWLLHALPLSIWLPAKTDLPLIGWMLAYPETAYLFSWAGMLFDTFIVLFLVIPQTRWLAYAAVVVFHTLTGILFQIGIFPVVMMGMATVFFSPAWHTRLLDRLNGWLGISASGAVRPAGDRRLMGLMLFFLLFQLLFPWRYLLYSDNHLFWTEEGYRFSWRVMLIEKAGTATFYVKDRRTGREGVVINDQFLNLHQEKQMAMQPDLILQFAHYLKDHYAQKGLHDASVRAEVWVTLNGRPAQLLIDPQVDLTQKTDTWTSKDWILPFKNL